jgi:hypothetical protein
LSGGDDRKDLTQRVQRKGGEHREKLRRKASITAEEQRTQRKPHSAGRIAYTTELVAGLAGTFGAGLEEFFYFLDVGWDVNAHGVVGGFYYVDVEAVFQPAELL